MATPPSKFPFFPYPAPTQLHGYYYPPPFPYPAYAPGPVFPPPPCGFGAPAHAFFPAPANPYHLPVQVVVQNDTDPAQPCAGSAYLPYPVIIAPPPASNAPPATDSSSSPAHHTSSGRPNYSLHHHHFPPTSDHLLVQAAPQPTAVPTAPNRERRSPQSHSSFTSSTTTTPVPTIPTTDSASKMQQGPAPLLELQDSVVNAVVLAHSPLHGAPEVTSSTPRNGCAFQTEKSGSNLLPATADYMCQGSETEEYGKAAGRYDCARTSSDAHPVLPDCSCQGRNLTKGTSTSSSVVQDILGELSKLSTLVSQYAEAMGLQTTEARGTGSSSAMASPQFTPSMLPASASTVPSATAHAAPDVFGEMPKPISWQGTHGSVPEYHSGHHTPIRSTLLDGNSNLREQNVEGMHQAYGLPNLICQTVVRADGTEHSYYALPENYHVERATSKHRSAVLDDKTEDAANESIDVFTIKPEKQPCEEQQECEQLLMFLSKKLATEHASACVNIISDGHDFTPALQTYEIEQLDDKKASVIVQQPREPQWNALLIQETRKKWDPGEHPSYSSTQMKATGYCSLKCISWLSIVLQYTGDQIEGLKPLFLTTPWDPGVWILQFQITCSSTRTTRNIERLKFSSPTSCESPQPSSVKCSTFHLISNHVNVIFSVRMVQNALQTLRYLSAINTSSLSDLAMSFFSNPRLLVLSASCQEITKDYFASQELMANASSKVAVVTWHSSLSGTPFILLSISYTWDPGILCMIDSQKEMGRVLHEQWRFWFNTMHYCLKNQNCITMTSQLYWHDYVDSNEVALCLMHFQPP